MWGMVARGVEGMGPRIREETGGGRGNGGGLGVEGVLMGGMVARGVEGMGPRMREETGGGGGARLRRGGTPILAFPHGGDGSKGGLGGMGPRFARKREGMGPRQGGFNGGDGRGMEGGMGSPCASLHGGGAPPS